MSIFPSNSKSHIRLSSDRQGLSFQVDGFLPIVRYRQGRFRGLWAILGIGVFVGKWVFVCGITGSVGPGWKKPYHVKKKYRFVFSRRTTIISPEHKKTPSILADTWGNTMKRGPPQEGFLYASGTTLAVLLLLINIKSSVRKVRF